MVWRAGVWEELAADPLSSEDRVGFGVDEVATICAVWLCREGSYGEGTKGTYARALCKSVAKS